MLLKKCMAFGGLTLFGIVGALVPMTMQEAEAKIPVLSVYGEAEVVVDADVAKVYGVIKKTSSDINETINLVDEFSELKEGIVEIGIASDNVKSLYFYDSAMNFDGDIVYRACLDFYVKTENMDSLKDVIELINSQDNAKVKNISYELTSDDAYKEALKLATENAISKAESLFSTDEMEISEIEEECYYYCDSSVKDFVSSDDLIEKITVKAKVKVTMDYAEATEEIKDDMEEVEIDKETGEIIAE